MDPYELRRLDFSLDDDHQAVRDSFAAFLAKESPSSLVRAAEPLGFDATLWGRLCAMGAASMGLPEGLGGDDAGVLELSLIAEEVGRRLAPVPFVDHVVASRLLARSDDPEISQILREAAEGSRIVGIALQPLDIPQVVPHGAVAQDVVGLRDGKVVLVRAADPRRHVTNQAGLPAAWIDADAEVVREVPLEGGSPTDLFERARREWKVLTAAALVGMTDGALALALDFVKTRETMGVSIATLQGVSFPLADIAIGTGGGRNLVWRAAWFLDHEPDVEPELAYAAIAYASQVATHGTTAAAHAQGGLGFTYEADASLYFLRAKGWALGAGDPHADIQTVGELRLASTTA